MNEDNFDELDKEEVELDKEDAPEAGADENVIDWDSTDMDGDAE